tara:strand:+ start:356 stop:1372 length:1017 start_codon:yes stop_codon:yes gene_type:complete
MADYKRERKKEDLYIKPKEQRRTKSFFVTSSAKMDESDGVNKTTISSSVFTKMSQSFAAGDYLLDANVREQNGSILYMLQEMQSDIDDVYNEVSASSFEASYFPFATIDSGSIGVISSSLIPNKDSKYDLGSSGKEWNDLYVDGTAYIDSLDLNGTNITTTLNTKAVKTHISGAFTSLSASIATDINNAGGADFSSVGEHIIPDGDNTRDLGSSTKEFKNLYIDGVAYIDTLNGTNLTAPIRHVFEQFTKLKSSTLDGTSIEIFEFNSSKALTVDLIQPAHPGQIVTIMNIGSGAVTITGAQSPKQTGIYNAKGGNYVISQHQVQRFIVNSNQIWYVL